MSQHRQTMNRPHHASIDLRWWQEIRLAIRLYRDPRVSGALKAIAPMIAALYVLSPIDLIPDFLLGLGQIDDVGVVGLLLLVAVAAIKRFAPGAVVDEHLAAMNVLIDSGPDEGRQERSDDHEHVIDASFTVGSTSAARDGRRMP